MPSASTTTARVSFAEHPDWWYGFHYREEAARGVESHEDIFVPGWFRTEGRDRLEVMFRAVAGFGQGMQELPEALEPIELAPRPASISVEERLEQRGGRLRGQPQPRDNNTALTTILAGYPWFGDWGRDTFVSLPGLLLETGRYAEARQVLEVFASSEKDGLVPNRFSDYGDGRDYKQRGRLPVVHPRRRRLLPLQRRRGRLGRDPGLGLRPHRGRLRPGHAVQHPRRPRRADRLRRLQHPAHLDGHQVQQRGVHPAARQAGRGQRAVAPRPVRHGPPHRDGRPAAATRYAEMPPGPARRFPAVFWNEKGEYLHDVVRDGWARHGHPPQPDPRRQPARFTAGPCRGRRRVVQIVQRELLRPTGCARCRRSIPPSRPQYEGPPFERDAACHQGTVWAWPGSGPYVEAYLRVNDFADEAKAQGTPNCSGRWSPTWTTRGSAR